MGRQAKPRVTKRTNQRNVLVDNKVWMTAIVAQAFEAWYALGPRRTAQKLIDMDREPDGSPKWELHTVQKWSGEYQWFILAGARQQVEIDAEREAAIKERARLAQRRIQRADELQEQGFRIIEKAELDKLKSDDARYLMVHAIKMIEIGMKSERLELGETTENIALPKPPKPLSAMSVEELRAYRSQLEALKT